MRGETDGRGWRILSESLQGRLALPPSGMHRYIFYNVRHKLGQKARDSLTVRQKNAADSQRISGFLFVLDL